MHATLRDANPELTPSVEDYLKVIYHLSNQGGIAATSDIAAMLDVAPPSVSGMVKRLAETGLIEHVPYRGVQLTAQGRRAALRMIRRHRLLELYLTQQLGYDWGGVHAEAERLEHAVSDELIDRMARALGDPLYDPHGDPIPTAAGEIEEAELVSLADAGRGPPAYHPSPGGAARGWHPASPRSTAPFRSSRGHGGGKRWRSRGQGTWSPWGTWILATGPPTWPGARSSATRCSP